MARVEIKFATRRDLCFTAANARDIDKREIIASGPRNMTEAGWITWDGIEQWNGVGWCVWIDGSPEYAFGFTPQGPLMPHLLSAWGWGSEKTSLAMPEMSYFAREKLIGFLDIMGAVRIEARSLKEHLSSHRWLEWIGFRKECDLPQWGKDREDFVQYTWLRSEILFTPQGRLVLKGEHHVHGRRSRLLSSGSGGTID